MRSRTIGAAVFFLLATLATQSCKDDKLLGLDIQPDGTAVGLVTSDTHSIVCTTVLEDSLPTNARTVSLLGRYTEGVFGYNQANIVTQVRLSTTNFTLNPSDIEVDSVVLALKFDNSYGADDQPQTFEVYELSEDLDIDSTYYSNRTPEFGQRLGLLQNYVPRVLDSVTVNGVDEPSQMRIPLDVGLMRSILVDAGDGIYLNNDAFTDHFKGMYVVSAYNGGGDQGAILYFNLLSAFSRMTMYYRDLANDDTLSLDYFISDSTAYYTEFLHNYNVGSVSDFLNKPERGNENIYVQSMGGIKTKVEFPNLEKLVDDGRSVVINKAEITFTVEENTTSLFAAHEQLFLARILEDGTTDFVLDQLEGSAHFGGGLDADAQTYTFNVTRHVQQILDARLNGETLNFGLYLVASGGTVNANRVKLKGVQDAASPIKLTLSYTPV